MSVEELKRQEVMSRVSRNELGLKDAAALMEVSYRHAKRIWRRYQREGVQGLVHRSAGRRSSRSKPAVFREQVLAKVREKYSGDPEHRFGPTLAAEHLSSEDGLEVDAETLRRWMLAEGLWSRARKGKPYRQRRERRKHFGELVQFDGSPHDWFEGRSPGCMLMNMVDDATSTSQALFSAQETIWAAANVLRKWVTKYGIPRALYTDWKNIYKQKATPGQQLRGENPTTQFGRMCSKLGIRIIAANSAQAKGRVERNHGTHQDRLIKKMRLQRISSIEAGNRFLPGYLAEHNRRFTDPPADAVDYHVPLPKGLDLDEVFRLETTHTVGNDWVVQHKGLLLQIRPQSRHYAPARAKVTVCEWQDGRIKIYYRDREIGWEQIPERLRKPAKPAGAMRHRPSAPPQTDHPWRRSFKDMRPRQTGRPT